MGNNMNYGKYSHSQMIPRVTDGCAACGEPRMHHHRPCDDCRRKQDQLMGMPIAMGYVPWQTFECTYEPMQGLHAGTIFPELDKPFYGRRGLR